MKSLLPAFALAFGLANSLVAGENWPAWRGPDGNGISDSTGLPTTWSVDENIVWKTELPSWSGGTPVVWGDRVFITSPTKSESDSGDSAADSAQQAAGPDERPGRQRGRRGGFGGRRSGGGRFGGGGQRDPGGPILTLICISKQDGSILWQRKLDEGNRLWRKQNNTSPSPVTDGEHVWVVTGTGAVTAFNMDGNQVWQRKLQEDYSEFGLNWGYASSPILHDGKLIIQVLHGNNTDEPSYVVAFNPLTGDEIWHQERPTDARRESPDAYTTPVVLTVDGRDQIVISGGDYVTGHDAATGQEIWRAAGLNPGREGNFRIIASPVVADGMVYAPTRNRPLLALRAGGTGDVTTSHLAWKWDSNGGPDVPTPVCDGKFFYMVADNGVVTCLDAKTAEVIWGPERAGTGVTTSASPLLADGKLYITDESGVTTVLAAGPEYKKLATNELDNSYTLSSIAVAGKQLFLRTSTHLYCIADAESDD